MSMLSRSIAAPVLLVIVLGAASCAGTGEHCTEMIEPPEEETAFELPLDDAEPSGVAQVTRAGFSCGVVSVRLKAGRACLGARR